MFMTFVGSSVEPENRPRYKRRLSPVCRETAVHRHVLVLKPHFVSLTATGRIGICVISLAASGVAFVPCQKYSWSLVINILRD